jgi:hypothetical protein
MPGRDEEKQPPQQPGERIEILDPNLRMGFAQVPRPVLRADGLSDKAKIVYALLLDYAWQQGSCFPGQPRLAEDLHTTERTIRRALVELRDFKLITWKQRGLNQTNVYYILSLSENPNLTIDRPDRTFLSAPDRTISSSQDRTPVSAKKYTGEEYPVEEDSIILSKDQLSFSRKHTASRFSKMNELENETLADPDRTRKPKPGDSSGFKPLGELLSHRRALELGQVATDASAAVSAPGRPAKRGRAPKATEWIQTEVERYSDEFHDSEHLAQNTGQAARLWKASGLSEASFCQLMGEARATTKQYNVKKRAPGQAGELGLRNKMPYFFSVLRDLLGMKDEQQQGRAAPGAPAG